MVTDTSSTNFNPRPRPQAGEMTLQDHDDGFWALYVLLVCVCGRVLTAKALAEVSQSATPGTLILFSLALTMFELLGCAMIGCAITLHLDAAVTSAAAMSTQTGRAFFRAVSATRMLSPWLLALGFVLALCFRVLLHLRPVQGVVGTHAVQVAISELTALFLTAVACTALADASKKRTAPVATDRLKESTKRHVPLLGTKEEQMQRAAKIAQAAVLADIRLARRHANAIAAASAATAGNASCASTRKRLSLLCSSSGSVTFPSAAAAAAAVAKKQREKQAAAKREKGSNDAPSTEELLNPDTLLPMAGTGMGCQLQETTPVAACKSVQPIPVPAMGTRVSATGVVSCTAAVSLPSAAPGTPTGALTATTAETRVRQVAETGHGASPGGDKGEGEPTEHVDGGEDRGAYELIGAFTHARTHARTITRAHTRAHTHVHTRTRTHARAHTNTCTHTCTHARRGRWRWFANGRVRAGRSHRS